MSGFSGFFHPITLCVTSNENSRAYKFLLETTGNLLSELNCELEPHFVMSDGAKSISLALDEFFNQETEYTKLMCKFHAKSNIKKKLCTNYFPNMEKDIRLKAYQEINFDIKILENACKKELYSKFWEIFKEKWDQAGYKKFLKYFEENWILQNEGWTNAFRKPGIPSTNNAVEGFNNFMKIVNNREKKELGMFLKICLDTVSEKSRDNVQYCTTRKIDSKIWRYVEALNSVSKSLFVKDSQDNVYI